MRLRRGFSADRDGKVRRKIAVLACVITAFNFVFSAQTAKCEIAKKAQQTVKLPEPKYDGSVCVEKALLKRRSVRSYKDEPLALVETSQLLWAAQGITDASGLRTAPSAGALYPLETYLVAGNVEGLAAGVYKYAPERHELVKVAEGDKRAELCGAAFGQASLKEAALVIVLCAVYERTTGRYGKRGVRYVDMELGHAAQNVCLQAVALNLGTVVIGAFNDDKAAKILNPGKEEQPAYMIPVGRY